MLLGASLLLLPVLNSKEVKEAVSGEVFPDTVSFDFEGNKYNLDLTGTAIRKKYIVKVYAVAHYLEQGPVLTGDKYEQILTDDRAKQLTMRWLRGVTAEQLVHGYKESLEAVFGKDNEFSDEVEAFLGFLNVNVKKGDVHILRWIPGGVIEYLINDQKVGTIENEAFAKGLWATWIGPNSVVNRQELTSLLK